MKYPLFTIERWPNGWLLSGERGIPMTALADCGKLFPKSAVIDGGILHHYRTSGRDGACFCVATPSGAKAWRAEILADLAGLELEEQWWRGLDVGTSSSSIFGSLGTRFSHSAKRLGRGTTPCDSGDFGRCSRLLARFPAWRSRLNEVAQAYPDGKWPAIVARWDELENATDDRRGEILSAI